MSELFYCVEKPVFVQFYRRNPLRAAYSLIQVCDSRLKFKQPSLRRGRENPPFEGGDEIVYSALRICAFFPHQRQPRLRRETFLQRECFVGEPVDEFICQNYVPRQLCDCVFQFILRLVPLVAYSVPMFRSPRP